MPHAAASASFNAWHSGQSMPRQLQAGALMLPSLRLQDGHNTRQAINYGYRSWKDFFNARQLLCLSILADAIRAIEDLSTRELFACLFSGTLEFNNMFASYKGEGTGAVRHMFAHHILKPGRTPLPPACHCRPTRLALLPPTISSRAGW